MRFWILASIGLKQPFQGRELIGITQNSRHNSSTLVDIVKEGSSSKC